MLNPRTLGLAVTPNFITPPKGDAVVSGTAGSDAYLFFPGGLGHNIVAGFQSGADGGTQDYLDFSALGVTNATFAQMVHIAAGPDGTTDVTVTGRSLKVSLDHTPVSQITRDDFGVARVIEAPKGNATVSGSGFSDVFHFTPGGLGRDVITDFQHGVAGSPFQDYLDVSSLGLKASNFGTPKLSVTAGPGGSTNIRFAGRSLSINLEHTPAATITRADFLFAH